MYHTKMFYCDASKKCAEATVYTVNIEKPRKQGTRSLTGRFVSYNAGVVRFVAERSEAKFLFECHIKRVKIWAILT